MLEYCPGIKINDAAALDAKGLDRQRLARLAVESYLQQILNYGFFHAGMCVIVSQPQTPVGVCCVADAATHGAVVAYACSCQGVYSSYPAGHDRHSPQGTHLACLACSSPLSFATVLQQLLCCQQCIASRRCVRQLLTVETVCMSCADPHPGNVAVDAETGSLIYYDFGMMGSIPGGVRGGLMELFYGVYEKDADRCLEALITMGVLVPTGDKLAVRRTAQFFLSSFQV